MKKHLSVAGALLALGLLAGCANAPAPSTEPAATTEAQTAAQTTGAAEAEKKVIKVGASPAPHAEILAVAGEVLAESGYTLEIIEYTDYVQPNNALEAGDLDANYFQHYPYLEQFNKENGTKIVSSGAIHYEPFGIYQGKTKSLSDLSDGAQVAVPNDVTNEARALLLLAQEGLITLKEGADLTATKNDIVDNPKNLDILEIEAAQIPRSVADVDIAVINGNYALEAGFKVKDALAVEAQDSLAAATYANILAVREGDEKTDAILALLSALQSDAVKEFIESTYEGAVVPIF